ncbi:MAG: hypothetical protein MUF54_17975 [Polyangiaceae bacterium]|jgi:hypothetical protein|nr:hypothetical protein [Polyangiaceae bacterium]
MSNTRDCTHNSESVVEPTDPRQQSRPSALRFQLRVLQPATAPNATCDCRREEYLWNEEVELLRDMGGIKRQARQARAAGDEHQLAALRTQFDQLKTSVERLRRQRLDSLGWFDYD